MAMVFNTERTMALEATGALAVNLGSLASVGADLVTVAYNTSGTAYTNQTITVGTVSASLNVAAGSVATPVAVVTVIFFNAHIPTSFTLFPYTTLFRSASGIIVVADSVVVTLS